ncbi:prephenate dehydratase [bacterium]
MSINDLRSKISNIDKEIIELLNKRAETSLLIGEYKRRKGLSIYDMAREQEVLNNLYSLVKEPLKNSHIEYIFKEIFSCSRYLQTPAKVAFLGPECTYSHLAAIKFLGSSYDYIPVKTINDVFFEVEKESVDFGIVPIENSTEGMVTYTLDVMMDSDVKIYSQVYMNIHHNLVSKAKEVSDIKVLCSHPQPIAQCRNWIEINMPNVKIKEMNSTAQAVEYAAKNDTVAAIASIDAAVKHNLFVLYKNIEDKVNNVTKFLIVSKQDPIKGKLNKTSIMFSIKDDIGALYNMLLPFKENDINLTKIESRPTKKKAWEYVFFVDFLGHKDDEKVKEALDMLEKKCLFLKIFGSYPINK